MSGGNRFTKTYFFVFLVFLISIGIGTNTVFADVITTLDSDEDVGEYPSIAIGSDGNPIISYYDGSAHRDLKVVHCTNASCSTQDTPVTLDSTDSVGRHNAIAIGNDGNPIISYSDDTNDDLKVVHCTNPSCTTQDIPVTLDNTADVSGKTSIAIGTDGKPIISYSDDSNVDDVLKIVHCADTICSTKDLPVILDTPSSCCVFETSIAIGTDGNPIVSYIGANDFKIVHCTNIFCTASDVPEIIDESNQGKRSSIAIGDDGFPIASYYDEDGINLRVVHCKNISCSSHDNPVELDSEGDVGSFTSLAIGNDGKPIISYYDLDNADLKVVQCTNPTCNFSDNSWYDGLVLDDDDNVGRYASIATGNDGNPIVSYYDFTNKDLKVVHCTNASCFSQDSPIILDETGIVGLYTSIAIGNDGNPIISYYDLDNADLKGVKCTDISCTTKDTPVTLDDAGNVSLFTAISIPFDCNAIISYYDSTNEQLKLVHCTNSSCTTNDTPVTLDSAGIVTWDISIAARPSPTIVSYYDNTNDDLKVVRCTNTSCSAHDTPVTLDDAGEVGRYTSIAKGFDGNPIISYYDVTEQHLKLVHCTNSSCTTNDAPVFLDVAGDVGLYTSIAIGNNGNPVISYFDNTNGNLKVIHCSDFSCTTKDNPVVLDSQGTVGWLTSMTIGKNNLPIISYYDETKGDLKVITQFEKCSPTGPGTWIVGNDCTLDSNDIAPQNVRIENNSRLTILPGITLGIDFSNYSLTIFSGSSVLIKFGGAID